MSGYCKEYFSLEIHVLGYFSAGRLLSLVSRVECLGSFLVITSPQFGFSDG